LASKSTPVGRKKLLDKGEAGEYQCQKESAWVKGSGRASQEWASIPQQMRLHEMGKGKKMRDGKGNTRGFAEKRKDDPVR